MNSQASLYEQLKWATELCNQAGLYDAADYINNTIKSIEMKEKGFSTKPGRFYLHFEDETVKEAINSHGMGFDSIEDAIGEANAIIDPGVSIKYDVLNSALQVMLSSSTGKT